MPERLTSDEDHTLRNLHWLESIGAELSAALAGLKADLLSRDLRTEVREPLWEALVVAPPAQRSTPLPHRFQVLCACGWRSGASDSGALAALAHAHEWEAPL